MLLRRCHRRLSTRKLIPRMTLMHTENLKKKTTRVEYNTTLFKWFDSALHTRTHSHIRTDTYIRSLHSAGAIAAACAIQNVISKRAKGKNATKKMPKCLVIRFRLVQKEKEPEQGREEERNGRHNTKCSWRYCYHQYSNIVRRHTIRSSPHWAHTKSTIACSVFTSEWEWHRHSCDVVAVER